MNKTFKLGASLALSILAAPVDAADGFSTLGTGSVGGFGTSVWSRMSDAGRARANRNGMGPFSSGYMAQVTARNNAITAQRRSVAAARARNGYGPQ